MKKAIIILILLGGAIGAGFAMGFFKDRALHDEALKKAEASAIEAATDHKTAQEATEKQLKKEVAKHEDLQKQVDKAIKEIKKISGRPPKIEQVIKWKSKPIVVPVEKLIPVPFAVPADCTECVDDYLESLPPFEFYTSGVEVTLETELGNTFLVGTVELIRSSPEPRVSLGTADFEENLTDILVIEEPELKKPLKWTISAGLFSDDSYEYATLVHRRFGVRGRFGVWGGSLFGGRSCSSTLSYDQDRVIILCDSVDPAAVAGLSLSF